MPWKLDVPHSSIQFSAKHMMISTVRGHFSNFDVTAELDEANPQQSHVEATIQAASLSTNQDQRDGHLRSPDFFHAEQYPTLTFRSTQVEPLGGDKFKVTGDLTIKDVTKPVVLNVTSEGKAKDPYGNMHWGFSGETSINRKDFGLNWNVALETGGWMVGETVKISIEIEFVEAAVPAELVGATA